MNKKLCLILLSIFLCAFLVNTISYQPAGTVTAEVIVDYYPYTDNYDSDTPITSLFPDGDGGDGQTSAMGQCFTSLPYDVNLTKVGIFAYQYLSPTQLGTIQIYEITGTYGTNAKPTGSALAESDPINATTFSLTSSNSYLNFTFSGANKITLLHDHYYAWVLVFRTGNEMQSNGTQLMGDASLPTHDGNNFIYSSGGTWTVPNAYDRLFYVYGEAEGSWSTIDTWSFNLLGYTITWTTIDTWIINFPSLWHFVDFWMLRSTLDIDWLTYINTACVLIFFVSIILFPAFLVTGIKQRRLRYIGVGIIFLLLLLVAILILTQGF